MRAIKSYMLFGLMILALTLSACAHNVGGKSVDDAFQNSQTRQLANAACRGDRREITQLVNDGADVNDPSLDGVSVLMWALSCKNVEGVKSLLDNGADPNHRAAKNMNPVTIAASYQQDIRFLKLVVEAGGDVNAVEGSYEETALMTAFVRGVDTDNWDTYYFLLDAGADVNQKTSSGRTIGYLAGSYNRNCKLIELIGRGYTYDLIGELRATRKQPKLRTGSPSIACHGPLIKQLEERILELGLELPE